MQGSKPIHLLDYRDWGAPELTSGISGFFPLVRFTGFLRMGLLLAILAFVSISCSQKTFDTKEELTAYISDPDNGYRQEKVIKGVRYSLTYKPTDLLVLHGLNNDYSDKDLWNLRDEYGKYLYFSLEMGFHGKELLGRASHREAFGTMLNQVVFGMGKKLDLVTKKRDTIPLLDYISPRLYGMGKSTELLLVYERKPKIENQEYVRLTIGDLGFGTGEVTFKIPIKKFTKQPQLKL